MNNFAEFTKKLTQLCAREQTWEKASSEAASTTAMISQMKIQIAALQSGTKDHTPRGGAGNNTNTSARVCYTCGERHAGECTKTTECTFTLPNGIVCRKNH